LKRIIYKNNDNSVGILIPTQEALDVFGIDAIAKKDVPYSLPYWIVDTSTIPSDRSDRSAWELDEPAMGDPDGYGGESNEFESVGE
jgi:hypothetical protein